MMTFKTPFTIHPSRSFLPFLRLFFLFLFLLLQQHQRVVAEIAHDSILDDGIEDEREEAEKNMTMMEKFRRQYRSAEEPCCRTCVQPFDWHSSPGSIDCREEFGPQRKCKGSCMFFIVKHLAGDGGRKTTPTMTMTMTTKTSKMMKTETKMVVRYSEMKHREKPFMWRFCTKRPKAVQRLVAETTHRPNAKNCAKLKSLMFVKNLEDMDKVLDAKYYRERIEPSIHLIDCDRATFHPHAGSIGEMSDGVLASEGCTLVTEEFAKSHCHRYELDGTLHKRKLNFDYCNCRKPINVTEINENYHKTLKEQENNIHFFNPK